MDDEIQAIVIDNGAGMMKAGFSGDDAPRAVFPNIVGRPRTVNPRNTVKEWYIGDEGCSRGRGFLTLHWPMKNGLIDNWDDMEKVWHHTFYNELRVAPEEQPVLHSISPFYSTRDKEKIAELMFDCFNVPGMSLEIQQVLSLYASGRMTGIGLDIGDTQCVCIPAYEGHALLYACQSRPGIAGKHVTDYLQKLLNDRKYPGGFTTTAEREIIRDIKEKLCYLQPTSADPNNFPPLQLGESEISKFYELPDGQVISVDTERFEAPEPMFSPWLLGKEETGIHEMIVDSIRMTPTQLRSDFFSNIVLAGGGTMFPGLADRLTNEMNKLVTDLGFTLAHPPPELFKDGTCALSRIPNDLYGVIKKRYMQPRVKVISPPERKYSVWIGGSILSSLSTFQNAWVSKEEYDEFGSRVVGRKCY